LAAPQEVAPLIGAINEFMGRLDTALAALRHFTGNASHQLRTPLSVVRTQFALIERAKTPSQATAAMDQAKSALARAERVLAQLLVLARVDATQSAGAMRRVNVADVARQTTAELVPSALQAGIDLGYEGPASAEAFAEAVLLGELLKNLIENAIAYAGRGAIVTVRLIVQPLATVLEVEDNGPGMDIWQMPQRGQSLLQSNPKDLSKGYGLGLAICTEIAGLFGAKFHLHKSAGDTGLRVEVVLPREPPIGRQTGQRFSG
jgi:two-component system sensor histidine kinase TctE